MVHNHNILTHISLCIVLWGYIYTKYSIMKSPILELTNQIQVGLYTLTKLKIGCYEKIWEIVFWRNDHKAHVLHFWGNIPHLSPKWECSRQKPCSGFSIFSIICSKITSKYHYPKITDYTLFYKTDYRKIFKYSF